MRGGLRSLPFARGGVRGGLRSALLALTAGALLAGPVVGQRLRFRHLGSEDGLANPWVWAILQDHHGLMWFGTVTGLNRYNGYSMEVFRHRPDDSTSIADQYITALYEDRAGTLWVGTRSSLSRFDRARDAFRNYMVQEGLQFVARRRVYAMLDDSRRRFWVGTTSGLFLFDRASGRETLVRLPHAPDSSEQVVQVILEDARGHLWLATERSGLLDYDPDSGRVRVYLHDPTDPSSLPDNDVRSILIDPAGQLWLGMYNAGLVRLDPATGRIRQYRHRADDSTSLAIDRVRRLVPDGAGSFWVGTENGGLDRFDPRTGHFQHTMAAPEHPLGLTGNSIWALHRDRQGALWVGTFAGGVNLLRQSSSALRHYGTVSGDTTSLSYNSVLGFAEDRAGYVWVATDGGGLNRFDPASGSFTRYTTRNSNLNSDAVLTVAAEPGGAIWVGTWGGGISRFDPRTRRFTAYTTRNTNIPEDRIFSLCLDRKGRLWVGTWRSGLLLFDRKTASFIRFPTGPAGMQSQLWILRELGDGKLLLGTVDDGTLIFDPEAGFMSRLPAGRPGPHHLLSTETRAVLETPDGLDWIGTAVGLDRLDRRSGVVSHFTREQGIPGAISGLAVAADGYLWISSAEGITRFDPRTRQSWLYTSADGLGRDFNARAHLQTRDGTLYFGGNDGFDMIRPAELQQNRRKPTVVLTGFQLFNRRVPIGERGPLPAHISELQHLTLAHDQSVFTLEFAALDYTAPAKNRYMYRLEGFDRDWTYAGGARTVTYTGLPPGEYVFRVKGSNNDGLWNEQPTSLRITIAPPLWQTWWFRTPAVLLVAGGITLVLLRARRRHRYLQDNVLEMLGAMQRFSGGDYSVALEVRSDDAIGKLRQGLNAAVADRKRAEEELRQSQKMEAVGRLAGGVAHDFNNLLTAIKGNAQLALSDIGSDGAVREELQEVQRAAERAGSLTRQLLAFSRKQILQPRVLSLNEVVADMGRLLRRTVGEDIELRTVLEPALGYVRADPGQIEQVLMNLAVNARDAMPRGGTLTIETANLEPGAVRDHAEAENLPYVALIVRDSGVGMSPRIVERVFEPFFTTKEQGKGTGLGLSTVYGIVKQSGGYIRVESVPGEGSIFSVYLPRVAETADAGGRTGIDAPPVHSATVLVVEDEPAVRRLACRVLERSGYTVLSADSGEAALALVDSHPGTIHLLLTDVVMPGMSGRELAERLIPRRPGMRLLYSSGYTEDAIVRHGVSGHSTAFLEKPFTPADLLRKVSEVLNDEPAPVHSG